MNSSETCIFCRIINKKLFAAVLHEDDSVLAFLDIKPVNTGHTLVVPKKHYVLVEEMDDSTYLNMFRVGRVLLQKIKAAFPEITAFNLLIADGKDAGQEVPHVHLHLIPRKPDDGFGYKFGPNYGKILTEEERATIAERIRSNM